MLWIKIWGKLIFFKWSIPLRAKYTVLHINQIIILKEPGNGESKITTFPPIFFIYFITYDIFDRLKSSGKQRPKNSQLREEFNKKYFTTYCYLEKNSHKSDKKLRSHKSFRTLESVFVLAKRLMTIKQVIRYRDG